MLIAKTKFYWLAIFPKPNNFPRARLACVGLPLNLRFNLQATWSERDVSAFSWHCARDYCNFIQIYSMTSARNDEQSGINNKRNLLLQAFTLILCNSVLLSVPAWCRWHHERRRKKTRKVDRPVQIFPLNLNVCMALAVLSGWSLFGLISVCLWRVVRVLVPIMIIESEESENLSSTDLTYLSLLDR